MKRGDFLNKYMRQVKEFEYRLYRHDMYATELRSLMGRPNYDTNYADFLRRKMRRTRS